MDKKDLIKSFIHFFTVASASCLSVDTHNNTDVFKIILKVISKEVKDPKNISIVSSSEESFKDFLPSQNNTIQSNSSYKIGIHTVSFYKYDKSLAKSISENTNILIFYPCNSMKEKDQIKLMDSCKNVKKTLFLDKNLPSPFNSLRNCNSKFITLTPNATSNYYQNMKDKLFNIK